MCLNKLVTWAQNARPPLWVQMLCDVSKTREPHFGYKCDGRKTRGPHFGYKCDGRKVRSPHFGYKCYGRKTRGLTLGTNVLGAKYYTLNPNWAHGKAPKRFNESRRYLLCQGHQGCVDGVPCFFCIFRALEGLNRDSFTLPRSRPQDPFASQRSLFFLACLQG